MSNKQNNNKIYNATTNGYAEVFTIDGQKVTATSSASASSGISYRDALSIAKLLAYNTALSQAKIEADKINNLLISNKNIIKNESNEQKIEILEEKVLPINKIIQNEIELEKNKIQDEIKPTPIYSKNGIIQKKVDQQDEIKKEENNINSEEILEDENEIYSEEMLEEDYNQEENNINSEEKYIECNQNENKCKYYFETSVCYRGKSSIENNEYIEILLPNYEEKKETEFTFHITPLCNKFYYVNQVENNKFKVFGENGSFNWIVFGKII